MTGHFVTSDRDLDLEALVDQARTGDREAFATIYDTYADRVFSLCVTLTRDRGVAEDAMSETFLVAWQRLDQLRDLTRLRAWLFAIARNRVTRLGVRHGRETAVDPVGDDLAGLVGDEDPGDRVTHDIDTADDAERIWRAAAGLNPQERALLELSVRQGLEGAELARALGVTRHHANVIAGRMRDNLAHAMDAVALLEQPRGRCPALDQVTADFVEPFDALWRKRIARHARRCATCGEERRRPALASFAAAPLLLAPTRARAEILDALPTSASGAVIVDHSTFRADRNGFPVGGARRWAPVGLGAGVLLGVGLVVSGLGIPERAPSEREAVDVGAPTPTTVVENDPPTDLTTLPSETTVATTTAPAPPDTTAPTDSSPAVDAGADGRIPQTTGPTETAPTAPTTTTTTTAPDTTAPTISGAVSLQPGSISHTGCTTGPYTTTLVVPTEDDRGAVAGQATVSVGGVDTTIALHGSGTLTGTVGPFPSSGSLQVTVDWVEDAAGNRSGPGPTVFGAIAC